MYMIMLFPIKENYLETSFNIYMYVHIYSFFQVVVFFIFLITRTSPSTTIWNSRNEEEYSCPILILGGKYCSSLNGYQLSVPQTLLSPFSWATPLYCLSLTYYMTVCKCFWAKIRGYHGVPLSAFPSLSNIVSCCLLPNIQKKLYHIFCLLLYHD